MNNFDDVYALNRDERQISNLETYRRFISKGDKPLECINDEDAKAIKDVLSGKGKLLAVVDGRRSMAGNHKYVLFVKEEGGVKVYLYTILNGLYNEMGPYKDLDTAMSNADCYGLFEECKQVANTKVLENNMNKKLFEEIIDELDEVADEVIDSIAEEVFNTYSEDMFNKLEFELNSSSIIGPDGRQDYGKLKDDIKAWSNIEDEIDLDEDPVSISEVYMQSQNYEDFFLDRLQYWMDCNEGNCLNESVKSRKLRENEDWDDDDVMTYDGDEMEDWSWEDEPEYDDDTYGYKSPSEELSDHFADNFPTRDPEYQNDEGDYDPFTYTQMGDGSGAICYRTKAAAYAHNLRGGDYAPTLDDGTVLGGDFDNDDDSNFAMSDDADLDDWVREGKK